MKMQWVEANSAQERDNKKYLGEYRIEPEQDDLEAGCWYYNKVTGCTYEWSAVEDDKPHFDFSRTPNSGGNDWHERGELPPVGTECEYYRCEHNDWKSCRIEFIGRRVVVMSGTNGSEFCRKIAKLKFRPLKTERERAIEEMVAI